MLRHAALLRVAYLPMLPDEAEDELLNASASAAGSHGVTSAASSVVRAPRLVFLLVAQSRIRVGVTSRQLTG